MEEQEERQEDSQIFGLTPQQVREIKQTARDSFFKAKKVWRQRGFWLVCVNCENRTAVWLGPNKVMVGEDSKGDPILQDK